MTIKQHARQRGYFLCTPVMACFTDESGWDMGLADAVLTTCVRLFVDEQRWKKKKRIRKQRTSTNGKDGVKTDARDFISLDSTGTERAVRR